MRNNVIAALNFLRRNPPDLQEVTEALAAAVKDADRVDAIVGRMRALMQKASPRLDPVDMNEALQEVIELTRGEALKNGVSVESQLAQGLPIISGDRVQLQQVVLNLILNALQAMGAVSDGARQVLITTDRSNRTICALEFRILALGSCSTCRPWRPAAPLAMGARWDGRANRCPSCG